MSMECQTDINEIVSTFKPSKNDYDILAKLHKNKAVTPMYSLTVNDLKEKTKLSIQKIRKTLQGFQSMGYVNEGAYDGHAKTYFITQEGINCLQNLVDDKGAI